MHGNVQLCPNGVMRPKHRALPACTSSGRNFYLFHIQASAANLSRGSRAVELGFDHNADSSSRHETVMDHKWAPLFRAMAGRVTYWPDLGNVCFRRIVVKQTDTLEFWGPSRNMVRFV
jgi:hypothetical protein